MRLISIVLLFILAGGIVYHFGTQNSQSPNQEQTVLFPTPTPVPTTTSTEISSPISYTWEKYHNQKMSFEYPADWVVIPDEWVYENEEDKIDVGVSSLTLVSQEEHKKELENPRENAMVETIRINVWDIPGNFSLQAYNESLTYDYEPSGGGIAREVSPGLYSAQTTMVRVAGMKGYYDPEAWGHPTPYEQYVIPYGNKFIELKLLKLGDYHKSLNPGYPEDKVVSHILSTLRLY